MTIMLAYHVHRSIICIDFGRILEKEAVKELREIDGNYDIAIVKSKTNSYVKALLEDEHYESRSDGKCMHHLIPLSFYF